MIEIPKIVGLDRDQVLTLMNCRSYKQYLSMIGDYEAGRCPFCDPLGEQNIVIQEKDGWRIWKNPYPIKQTSIHLVLAPKIHITSLEEIHSVDFFSVGCLLKWAIKEFEIPGGGFVMRFGSPEWNAGSVLHLHANIIVPDGSGAVQATLSKEPKKVAETIARMQVFERLRAGAELPDLSPEEAALIEGRMG